MNGVTSTDSRENSPLVPILIPSSPSPRLRREYRKVLHPLTGDTEDGYSVHTPTPPIHYPPPPVTPDDHEELTGKSSLPDSFSSANIHRKGVESLRSGSQSPPASIIDNSASGGISRRPGSRFSGLSLLETITEQKSNSTMRKRRDSIGNSGSENSEISGISERTSPGEETCLLGGGGEKDCEDGSEDIEKLCFFRDFSDTASPLCPSLPLGDAPLFTGNAISLPQPISLHHCFYFCAGSARTYNSPNRIHHHMHSLHLSLAKYPFFS
ncbi:hypothetical protein RUND412_001022 [Rhizina undulata]